MKTLFSIASCVLIVASTNAPVAAQGYAGPRVRPSAHVGGGPNFCRSGRGHPVHGWSWCASRGWRPQRTAVRGGRTAHAYWTAAGWHPVFVGNLAAWGRHAIPGADLESVLGRRTERRIRRHAHRAGLRGRLIAYPLRPREGGPGLEVWAGGRPVARLIDYDRDGWTETTLLWTGRSW